jgi:hypothetical protein
MMYEHAQRGAVALITVIILIAATLVMVTSGLLISLGDVDNGYTIAQGDEALTVADGCLEETLRRLRLDSSYGSTTENLTVANGSCVVDVVITMQISKRRLQSLGRQLLC